MLELFKVINTKSNKKSIERVGTIEVDIEKLIKEGKKLEDIQQAINYECTNMVEEWGFDYIEEAKDDGYFDEFAWPTQKQVDETGSWYDRNPAWDSMREDIWSSWEEVGFGVYKFDIIHKNFQFYVFNLPIEWFKLNPKQLMNLTDLK